MRMWGFRVLKTKQQFGRGPFEQGCYLSRGHKSRLDCGLQDMRKILPVCQHDLSTYVALLESVIRCKKRPIKKRVWLSNRNTRRRKTSDFFSFQVKAGFSTCGFFLFRLNKSSAGIM
ncbi:hypothetical protein SIN01_12600 [Sporolactobacillus inulinus]|jgi:hypothetical protein|nr:hypothetical protein SIN01_12600 [Sporolactobacillus inulinus]